METVVETVLRPSHQSRIYGLSMGGAHLGARESMQNHKRIVFAVVLATLILALVTTPVAAQTDTPASTETPTETPTTTPTRTPTSTPTRTPTVTPTHTPVCAVYTPTRTSTPPIVVTPHATVVSTDADSGPGSLRDVIQNAKPSDTISF